MSNRKIIRRLTVILVSALALIGLQPSVRSQPTAPSGATVRAMAATLFNLDANRITVSAPSGRPAVMRVERDGVLMGYLASTANVIGSVGYSGKPIDIMIAIDTSATILGARLLAQSEPILTIGISPSDIANYVGGFANISLGGTVQTEAASAGTPDAISGATVSSGVIRDGIIRTGRAVALAYGLLESGSKRRIDITSFAETDWITLLSDGALVRRRITLGDAREALGDPDYKSVSGGPDDLFAEMIYGLLTPAQIGQNLLGKRQYTNLLSQSNLGDQFLFVAANGLYSFKGTAWRKSGTFERIELHQENRSIRLNKSGYRNIQRLSVSDAPDLREIALFTIPQATGFDPTRTWRLSFLTSHETENGVRLSAAFPLYYTLPDTFFLAGEIKEPTAEDNPLWLQNWFARAPAIAVVCILLLLLAAILVFQDYLARRIRMYHLVRLTFLTATLVVLGWGLGAQLSVVQVLAFAQAIRTGFQWETFLLDPLIFILWSTVAVSLLFWGRGVFCGWLCPFGALQELLNSAARRLDIKQISVPFGLHERLWPIKYIVFLGLFALSLHSITRAFVFAEVEPFKTAITLKFAREWPFLLYVGILLIAGLFIERAYCRYLCPLGAALAIPARLRMFEWLKRRPQCGRECRICAVRCTVQAIHPNGQINPNECIHCLRCQTNYFDQTTCPPLKERTRRRAAFGPKSARPEQAASPPQPSRSQP